MLSRTAVVALALSLVACAELPTAPGAGAGGMGGNAGNEGDVTGGAGGAAGSGGIGGSGGDGGVGGVDPCTVLVPEPYENIEGNDVLQLNAAIGHVSGTCPGLPCDGDDPIDRWAITTCGGAHKVELSWDEPMHNLNLFLFTPDDEDSWSSQSTDSKIEVLTENLMADRLYIIQVQAADTNGSTQTYNVVVTRVE